MNKAANISKNQGKMLPPVSMSYWELVVGFFMYHYYTYLPEIILCVLQLFDIRSYKVMGDKEKYKMIIKKIEKQTSCSSYIYTNGKVAPAGYFIGKNCIGHYFRDTKYVDEERFWIITTSKFYNSLLEEDDAHFNKSPSPIHTSIEEHEPLLEPQKKTTIKVYSRSGHYKSFYYSPITLDVSHIEPIGDQGPIVENIIDLYKKKQRATVFIHGVSMAGKSSIGYLLAKKLNGIYCHSFNPTDPGDTFTNMITESRARNDDDDNKPLIIVLEEVNVMLNDIHTNTIRTHLDIPTQIKDKTSWCCFFDDRIFYKNVILVLTSNVSKETIDKLDPAYLNKHRIDRTFSMMNQLILDNDLNTLPVSI